jgi:tRNA(Ile)-lysidine synthase
MTVPDPFRAARIPEDFSADQSHLIGVSGGRDSIALLHWLGGRGFHRLIVCHLDHGLRKDSGEDRQFVEEVAAELGLECVTRTMDVCGFARDAKLSIETAARELRYRFFESVAVERQCPRLFLAHHADDQVETFLLHLLRGAGAGGLGGMAPMSERSAGDSGLTVARPLLAVWRSEIDAYVQTQQLRYREDATNAELAPTRNRIRHLAIPALAEAFGRDPREALWRAAELLRAENEVIEAMPALSELPVELDVPWLRGLPLGLQRRVLHRWLQRGGIAGVGFEEVEGVRALLHGEQAKVNLPGGKRARRREKRLFLDDQQPG